jgi:hypothetical protein
MVVRLLVVAGVAGVSWVFAKAMGPTVKKGLTCTVDVAGLGGSGNGGCWGRRAIEWDDSCAVGAMVAGGGSS